jgi:hypothetical protein
MGDGGNRNFRSISHVADSRSLLACVHASGQIPSSLGANFLSKRLRKPFDTRVTPLCHSVKWHNEHFDHLIATQPKNGQSKRPVNVPCAACPDSAQIAPVSRNESIRKYSCVPMRHWIEKNKPAGAGAGIDSQSHPNLQPYRND